MVVGQSDESDPGAPAADLVLLRTAPALVAYGITPKIADAKAKGDTAGETGGHGAERPWEKPWAWALASPAPE